MTCDTLRLFLEVLDATPRHRRLGLIEDAITHGDGNWNLPPTRPDGTLAGDTPALVEISLHGIWAFGLSLTEAADSWQRIARQSLAEAA